MKYTYADGSSNKYKLLNNRLEYDPMTPELSSSGTYSGGDPFEIELKKIDVIKLIDVLERAIWSVNDHSERRTKGCGTIIKNLKDENERFYLRYNSNSLNEINNYLKRIQTN